LFQQKGEGPAKDCCDLAVFPLLNAYSPKPKHTTTRCLLCFKKIFMVLHWHFWSAQGTESKPSQNSRGRWGTEFHTAALAWWNKGLEPI